MTDVRGALVDLDGTVYRGDSLLPGVRDGLTALAEAGVATAFLSNNATKRPAAYREKLAGFGIEVPADRVCTSAAITADYLAEDHATDGIYVAGEAPLTAELRAAGLSVVEEPAATDVVLLSLDRGFDYGTLADVLAADEDGGVTVYATNPDRTCPVEDGEIPDCGAMIGAVEGLLGRRIDAVLGKPSPVAVDVVLDRLGLDPSDCLIVGDRLETDVAMGAAAGMTTVLVLSGVTDEADVAASDVAPDYVIDSLADVGAVL